MHKRIVIAVCLSFGVYASGILISGGPPAMSCPDAAWNMDRSIPPTLMPAAFSFTTILANAWNGWNQRFKSPVPSRSRLRFTSTLTQQADGSFDSKVKYDYIIVGCGAAGSVLSSRLSGALRNAKILCLEAGKEDEFLTALPQFENLAMLSHQDLFDWGYESVEQTNAAKAMKNQKFRLEAAKVFGGGSTIGKTSYCRGHPFDWDEMEQIHGLEGWNARSMLKYLNRMEHVEDKQLQQSNLRGQDGPLNCKLNPLNIFPHEAERPLPLMIEEMAIEKNLLNLDYNQNNQIGISQPQTNIYNGFRQSIPSAYLNRNKAMRRPRLDIVTQARVVRVLFDENQECESEPCQPKAQGVELMLDNVRHLSPTTPALVRVFVEKEIILSAGAFGTPKVLQSSGIGAPSVLNEAGVEVVVDLPGVGKNYMDQWHIIVSMRTNNSLTAYPAGALYHTDNAELWSDVGRGPWGRMEDPAIIFHRPQMFNSSAIFRDEKEDWNLANFSTVGTWMAHVSDLSGIPLRLDMIKNEIGEQISSMTAEELSQTFTATVSLLRPNSKGEVKITSSSPFAPLRIDPKAFSDDYDLQALAASVADFVMLLQSSSSFAANAVRLHRYPIKECDLLYSQAASPQATRDAITEYAKCVIPYFAMPSNYPCCTAKMGSDGDEMAVLDAQMRVRGVHGLRVVDLSAAPTMPRCDTLVPTVAMAEKASEMIIEAYEDNESEEEESAAENATPSEPVTRTIDYSV